MLSKVLSTPVDDLVILVKKNPNCTLTYLQKSLKVNLEILEKWIIILEEFEVLTIQYRGFEGYVNMHKNKKSSKKKEINLDRLKDDYIERAKIKKFTFEKMKELWPLFLEEYKSEIKDTFFKKAEKAGYNSNKILLAWSKYEETLDEF